MPTFEIVNVGDTPVRISSVKTSCGCASATAEPLLVLPQGRSLVTVKMDPLEVGTRAATISLESDAASTPLLVFQVLEKGYRLPPYVFQVPNGLFFPEGYTKNEPREVIIDVIAVRGMPEMTPDITTDLSFLAFEVPIVRDKDHYNEPKLVLKSYHFPVKFIADPPEAGFSGQISIADPWNTGRELRFNVQGEVNRPIRVVPSRLTLNTTGSGGVRLLARSNRDNWTLVVSPEEENGPLIVKKVGEVGESGFLAFEVHWKPHEIATKDVYNIIVRANADGKRSLTVPVLVRH